MGQILNHPLGFSLLLAVVLALVLEFGYRVGTRLRIQEEALGCWGCLNGIVRGDQVVVQFETQFCLYARSRSLSAFSKVARF